MRKKIVAGNWKMNMHDIDVIQYLKELDELSSTIPTDVEVVVFPPAIYLDMVTNLTDYELKSGAQDCSANENGAYTGEISASMLASMDNEEETKRLTYCLVGHSERRQYHNEMNELLASKVNQLLASKLMPVYCCGESKEERESNNQEKVVKSQITKGLFHLPKEKFSNVVIAYEPVWAIGTGLTATSEQAQEMHAYIRSLIEEQYDVETANSTSILYGGSCKPSNAKELFAQPDIDGGLIGGASLKPDSFIEITKAFN